MATTEATSHETNKASPTASTIVMSPNTSSPSGTNSAATIVPMINPVQASLWATWPASTPNRQPTHHDGLGLCASRVGHVRDTREEEREDDLAADGVFVAGHDHRGHHRAEQSHE